MGDWRLPPVRPKGWARPEHSSAVLQGGSTGRSHSTPAGPVLFGLQISRAPVLFVPPIPPSFLFSTLQMLMNSWASNLAPSPLLQMTPISQDITRQPTEAHISSPVFNTQKLRLPKVRQGQAADQSHGSIEVLLSHQSPSNPEEQ